MRRRGCLWGFLGVVGVLVVCCVLAFFVGIPRVQDRIKDELGKDLSTQVAKQIDAQLPGGVNLSPGEYRVSLSDLEQQLENGANTTGLDGINISADGNEIVLEIKASGQTIEYRGVPEVNANGDLAMTEMTSNGGALDYILPPDKLGGAVALGINTYVEGQGLNLQDVHLEGDELVFDVVE